MKIYKRLFEKELFNKLDDVKILSGKWKNYYGTITSISGNNYLVTINESPEGEPLGDAPRDIKYMSKQLKKV